ncbi:MAG: family 10 glycosylhydrolase [Candidatus Marinimicrobia bacterium]|nr:family 10 glycosylhydrolase [Candidatus Neomarinimicrobiota bacterium]
MKTALTTLLLLLSMNIIIASPKHEFRAVWVSTAWGLDFPILSYSSGQKANIRSMLDNLKGAGFNAVVFQVRPGCDAFYNSNYEPWSHELNGSGIPPSPYYDPLEYFISEAHERGMELHAWFNPYRVSTTSNLSGLHSSHVYHQHPEWLLTTSSRADSQHNNDQSGMFSNTLLSARDGERTSVILDPGKAVVRSYVTDVFLDVVNNYDVDGVHMDDYFYPYGGMADEDAATFAEEPRGFTNINDWRRDNVNLLVESIYDSIQVTKPWVKFGVSPFGIWKNGVPAGIIGTSSYYDLYCDPIAWLDAGTVDYLTPQLYWPHGGGQNYALLMPWWASSVTAGERHLYVGHAPYRISDWHNWPANELPNQIRLNRVTESSLGSVYFRYRSGIVNNPKGFLDSLRNDLYAHPALTPPMSWKDDMPPNPPLNVLHVFEGDNVITWDRPPAAADGDTTAGYVLYGAAELPIDTEDAANIVAILAGTDTVYVDEITDSYRYVISSLDKLNTESAAITAQWPADIKEPTLNASQFVMSQNFPNPFNPITTIRYSLPRQVEVTLAIYDISGQLIQRLLSDSQPAGSYDIQWQGMDDHGRQVSTGVYFCRLMVGDNSKTIKMLYLQ